MHHVNVNQFIVTNETTFKQESARMEHQLYHNTEASLVDGTYHDNSAHIFFTGHLLNEFAWTDYYLRQRHAAVCWRCLPSPCDLA
jgi:hypothetical protein